MKAYEVKKVMDQVHISQKMQEEIIMNVKEKMTTENKRKRSIKKISTVAAAAAFTLVLGAVSVPVCARISDFVKARMESVPAEQVQEIDTMIREQNNDADGFSRDYSKAEMARSKELWKAYKNGTFPEGEILQVESADQAEQGSLCYVKATGFFYLPDREMTDEEILEIIDLQNKMSYAVSQSAAAQEAKAEMDAEKEQMREMIQAAGGISEAEAIEIARKQMDAELGEDAAGSGKEILKYRDGSDAVILIDIADETEYVHQGDVAYLVVFRDDNSYFHCMIDASNGSVLKTY